MNKFISISKLLFTTAAASVFLTACGGGSSTDTSSNESTALNQDIATTFIGSVGDGPITGAKITIRDKNGVVREIGTSDATASYVINTKLKGRDYPITIETSGGIDIVTNTAPDFNLLAVATSPSKVKTYNLNPYSTLITQLALAMNPTITSENIALAKEIILEKMNFGLDLALIQDPMTTKIDESNIASIVKASETFGEMIRRTRNHLISTGQNITGNDIVNALAADLTDGAIDGQGALDADARIAAISNIVIGQVAIETMSNNLKVDGANVATALDNAILVTQPNSTIKTRDIAVTEQIITQARNSVAATYALTADASIADTYNALGNVAANSLPKEVETILPSETSNSLVPAIEYAAVATTEELAKVNQFDVTSAPATIIDITGPQDDTTSPTPNQAPVISGTPATTISEGTAYSFTPAASDNDGDALSFAINNLPSWASFDSATGTLSGTPGLSDAGNYGNIVISVTDGSATAQLAPFAISVVNSNQAPTISGTPATTVSEGAAYSFTPVASDNDGDTLSFNINNLPSWASFNSATGTLSGTPGLSDAGNYGNIVISVTDGSATAQLAPFAISVSNYNQAPIISGTPATTVSEGAAYSFTPAASDNDGDVLSFAVSNLPKWAHFDSATGTLNGTPGLSDAGNYSNIVISVTDGSATAQLAPFAINVSDHNQEPVISGTPSTTISEGAAYSFTPTASDNDGDTLSFNINNLPQWASFDNATGTLSGTPGLSDAGNYGNIVISVTDGSATAQLAPFAISVVNSNQAPTISGTPATTVSEGAAYSFTPVASDNDGDTLSFNISNLPQWASFDSATGTLSGTPGLSDAGNYGNIVISVSDGVDSAQLSPFAISVSDANQALAISTHSPAVQESGIQLHNNITVAFDSEIDASSLSSSSVMLKGTSGANIPAALSANNQTITIDPVSNLDPLTTYSVTITSAVSSVNGEVMDTDYSWNFTTTAGSAIPDIDKWEERMTTVGEKWGQYLLSYFPAEGSFSEQTSVYYDAQRIYFQIAEYTGQQEPWNTYAQEAERVYMNYAVPNNFQFGGWRRFAQGIYMDYVRTGDMTAYENIVKIRDLPGFSDASRRAFIPQWYWESRSREIAYALESHIFAERVGHPRDDADIARYVTMALNHLKEWSTGQFGDPESHRRAPFMFGLTAEALIMFYEWELENGRDPTALYDHSSVPVEFIPTMTIPEALKSVADYLREEAVVESGDNIGKPMWVADLSGTPGNWGDLGGTGYAAFRYEDIKAGKPTPDLNLLVAPVYAWLFQHYGETKYITTADQLFVSGVNLSDINWNTKLFNQNYRWSFDYIKWRNAGFAKWN